MSSGSSSADAAKKALGTRLRRIRKSAGVTGRVLAAGLGIHFTWLSRIENGHALPKESQLRSWCRLCDAEDQVEDLVATLHLVEEAYTEWRSRVKAGMRNIAGPGLNTQYASTTVFKICETVLVPGLFQTESYVRAVLAMGQRLLDAPSDGFDAAVDDRLARAGRTLNGSTKILVVMLESALTARYLLTPDDREEQLLHLLTCMKLPFVSLGVIPEDAPRRAYASLGFWIFNDVRVEMESPSADIRTTRPGEVAVYLRLFEALQSEAVYGADVRRLILHALQR